MLSTIKRWQQPAKNIQQTLTHTHTRTGTLTHIHNSKLPHDARFSLMSFSHIVRHTTNRRDKRLPLKPNGCFRCNENLVVLHIKRPREIRTNTWHDTRKDETGRHRPHCRFVEIRNCLRWTHTRTGTRDESEQCTLSQHVNVVNCFMLSNEVKTYSLWWHRMENS